MWKYNKIPGKRPVSLQCLKIQQDCGQRGEHLDYWRRQIFCLRLQQDCRQRGKIFSNWSHQWVGNVWKYNKIAGNRGTCKLLKAPVIWPCIDTVAGQQGEILKSLTPPDILKCIKIQVDCRWRVNLDYWSHQIFFNVWQDNKIAGNGGKLKSLRPPLLLPVVQIEQNSRQVGRIWIIKATSYLAMCENTARFQASHQELCKVWKYNRIAGIGGNLNDWSRPFFRPCIKTQQDSSRGNI